MLIDKNRRRRKGGYRDRGDELVGESKEKSPDKTGYHLPLNDSEQAERRFAPIKGSCSPESRMYVHEGGVDR